MDKKDLFLKSIELELDTLKKEYCIRDIDLENIKHLINVLKEEIK